MKPKSLTRNLLLLAQLCGFLVNTTNATFQKLVGPDISRDKLIVASQYDITSVSGVLRYGCIRLMTSGILEMLYSLDTVAPPTQTVKVANLGPILVPDEQLRKYALAKAGDTYFIFGMKSIYKITGGSSSPPWTTSIVGPLPAGIPTQEFHQPPVYIGSDAFAISINPLKTKIFKWNSVLNTIGGSAGATIDLSTLSLGSNEVKLMFMMPNISEKQMYITLKPGDTISYTQPIFESDTISQEPGLTIDRAWEIMPGRNHDMNNSDSSTYRFCTSEKFVEVTSNVKREITFPTKFSSYHCWYVREAGGAGWRRLVLFADGKMMVIDTHPGNSEAFKIIARKRIFGQNFFVSFLD